MWTWLTDTLWVRVQDRSHIHMLTNWAWVICRVQWRLQYWRLKATKQGNSANSSIRIRTGVVGAQQATGSIKTIPGWRDSNCAARTGQLWWTKIVKIGRAALILVCLQSIWSAGYLTTALHDDLHRWEDFQVNSSHPGRPPKRQRRINSRLRAAGCLNSSR